MDYEESCVSLSALFDRNPAYGELYVAAIKACEEEVDESAAIQAIEMAKTSCAQTQGAASILDTLVRRGGIERLIFVDGTQYEGSLQELQGDEGLNDDIDVQFRVCATDAGLDSAVAYRDSKSLEKLFVQHPEYRGGFVLTLELCSEVQGAATNDVQRALVEAGVIEAGIASAQTIHASYFTSKLERFGALAWEGKRWHATRRYEQDMKTLRAPAACESVD